MVRTLSGHRSPAVLLRSHGVFTIGPAARAAVKSAVTSEDVARTIMLALGVGKPHTISSSDIDKLHERYVNEYGQ